jgi:hypothetical protein
LDGSEEIYTQTNDINEKFTLNQVSTYITQNIDTWLYKEVYMTGADLDALPTTKFELLSENDLNTNEYYEVNRLVFEADYNSTAHKLLDDIYVLFKTSNSIPIGNAFPDNSIFINLPNTLIECNENIIYCLYSPAIIEHYVKLTGLYIDSSLTASNGGDTVFKIKIYYKIKS